MKVQKFNCPKEIGFQVVEDLRALLKSTSQPVICIAGGDTTLPIMHAMVEAGKKDLNFTDVKFISLDEWGGLDKSIKGSCAQTLYDNLFIPLNIPEENIFFFNGAGELKKEVEKADQFIESYPIDYIVLGVGMNGHVGFNEPGVPDTQGALIVELDSVTKQVMSKYFDGERELTQGITLSLNQIRQAQKIIVVITGEHKKEIYRKTVMSVQDDCFPVSLLKSETDKISLYVDAAAHE